MIVYFLNEAETEVYRLFLAHFTKVDCILVFIQINCPDAGGKIIYAGVTSITDEEISKTPTDLYREGYEYYYRSHAHPNLTFSIR